MNARSRSTSGGGHKNRPDGDWLVLLVEEVGEVARDIQEKVWKDDCDRVDLEEELTQVAALAVAWLEESKEGRCGRKS